ncbi:hypothetical protein PLESTB_001374300 [Pleodorina starrii]|uniref:Uncharacterized protein n=1 Tax=Pleodorina starrii TaxID=330485 RepID=A0A9W6F6S2_9CHLO|nr:hypothetical protein PLESTM_000410800 [Pleodorina starrii]GLC58557.1 hypothetical protein PLESTB_001374300 [Pleodorina starrii]GLC74210.1 hypothetical protein PLESTF_001474100 [Pleodorina starrii]
MASWSRSAVSSYSLKIKSGSGTVNWQIFAQIRNHPQSLCSQSVSAAKSRPPAQEANRRRIPPLPSPPARARPNSSIAAAAAEAAAVANSVDLPRPRSETEEG